MKSPDPHNQTTGEVIKNAIDIPLMQYKLAIGHFPTTKEGLQALITAPEGAVNWRGPYLANDAPKDSWGNYYQYQCPGTHNPDAYDCWSMGSDGQNGTADDIGNW